MRNQDQKRFLDIVGKVDDIDIVLQYKPGRIFHRKHFYTQKKRYAINLCAVCDLQKKFIYTLAGFLNTTHDSQVWAAIQIQQYPTQYFTPGQYLLGDSAYGPTKYMILLYKVLYTLQRNNQKFNCQLSNIHIDIEHAFEMLKGQWKSLTRLGLIFINHK